MTVARRLLAMALAGVLGATSGCSWIFMDKPPSDTMPGEYVSCTEGRGAPVVDTIIGAAYVFSAIGFVSEGSSGSGQDGGDAAPPTAAGMLMLVFAAPFLLSAYSGFTWSERCRSLHDEAEEARIPPPRPPPPTKAPPEPRPDPRTDPAPGTLGHACRLDGTCDDGLSCTAGRCLNVMK